LDSIYYRYFDILLHSQFEVRINCYSPHLYTYTSTIAKQTMHQTRNVSVACRVDQSILGEPTVVHVEWGRYAGASSQRLLNVGLVRRPTNRSANSRYISGRCTYESICRYRYYINLGLITIITIVSTGKFGHATPACCCYYYYKYYHSRYYGPLSRWIKSASCLELSDAHQIPHPIRHRVSLLLLLLDRSEGGK